MTARADRVSAVGVESHSGWAAIVVVGGSRADPEVMLRDRFVLADGADASTKQPFHAAETMPFSKARAFIDSCRADAWKRASAEMMRLLGGLSRGAGAPRWCAVLTSSTAEQPGLESILASHARIHAAEGDHFRDAVAAAAERAGLSVVRIRRKDLRDHASRALGRPARELERRVAGMRRTLGAPWGADQKLAALAAWSLLA